MKEYRGVNALHSQNWSLMNTGGLKDMMTLGTWLCMLFVINTCCSWSMSSADLMILAAISALSLSGKRQSHLNILLEM